MSDIKYPKHKLDRKEKNIQISTIKLDAEKYHEIVENPAPEATIVTKREKHKQNKEKTPEQVLVDQALLSRSKLAVKEW